MEELGATREARWRRYVEEAGNLRACGQHACGTELRCRLTLPVRIGLAVSFNIATVTHHHGPTVRCVQTPRSDEWMKEERSKGEAGCWNTSAVVQRGAIRARTGIDLHVQVMSLSVLVHSNAPSPMASLAIGTPLCDFPSRGVCQSSSVVLMRCGMGLSQ